MSKRTIQLNVLLTASEKRRLDTCAKKQGLSQSDVVRLALERYLSPMIRRPGKFYYLDRHLNVCEMDKPKNIPTREDILESLKG